MKMSLLLTALVLSANLVIASAPSLPGPSTFSVCAAPGMAGLPQDNDFVCGDVNEDGTVNVLDIISMVNYILGANPDPFNLDLADINTDNIINVLDIIGLVNIILQAPATPCPCNPSLVYEGQTYTTVQIGDQCWFKENLNVGTKINSTTAGYEQQDNGVMEKYCYENNEENCNTYGGLYEWPEVMQYVTDEGAQGLCPPGWHLPTDEEWTTLTGFLGGLDLAGGRMKSTGTIDEGTGLWYTPNAGATNESGFNGFPGGYRDAAGVDFGLLGIFGFFWSSTQSGANSAWLRYLTWDGAAAIRVDNSFDNEWSGYSARCIKGCWPEPSQANAGPDQLDVPGTTVTLEGNTPTYGKGVWGIVSGTGGTFVDPWSPNAEFQGQVGNEYILSWTITTQCGSSTDEVAISFAEGSTFTCGDDLLYEEQSYATVQIGAQCWMAENLNVGTMMISDAGGLLQTDNGSIEKYCYENNATHCNTYGGLYEWPEAMQYATTEGARGICPEG